MEYVLGRAQQTLESKIEAKVKKVEELLEKIKQCFHNNNKITAKEYIKDVQLEKEAMSNLMLRKRLLAKQSNQLEESQSNIQLVENLEKSSQVLEALGKEVNLERLADIKVAAD